MRLCCFDVWLVVVLWVEFVLMLSSEIVLMMILLLGLIIVSVRRLLVRNLVIVLRKVLLWVLIYWDIMLCMVGIGFCFFGSFIMVVVGFVHLLVCMIRSMSLYL